MGTPSTSTYSIPGGFQGLRSILLFLRQFRFSLSCLEHSAQLPLPLLLLDDLSTCFPIYHVNRPVDVDDTHVAEMGNVSSYQATCQDTCRAN